MNGTPFDRIVVRLRQLRYHWQLANAEVWLHHATRLGRWALLRKLDLMGYPQRDRVGALLDREIAAIGPSVEAYLTHQKTEIEILSARLSRRYDPGAALNEATERAIVAKKLAMAAPGEIVPVTNEQFAAHVASTKEPDFWEREAARQREARDANPEPMQPLTPLQEKALDHQKNAVKRTIENS